MSNRDVRLTIKARDDASATIQKVKEALNNLEKGVNSSGRATVDLSTRMSRLGREATDLQSQFLKNQGAVSLKNSFDLISGTLTKVNDDFRKNRTELAQSRVAMNAAKAESDKYANDIKKVSTALGVEKKALNDANQEITKQTNILKKAQDDTAKYTAQISKADAELDQLRGALVGAQSAQAKARDEDTRAARAAEVLRQRLADLRKEREAANSVRIPRLSAKNGISAEVRETARADKAASVAQIDAQITKMTSLIAMADRANDATSRALSGHNAGVKDIEDRIRTVGNLEKAMERLIAAEGRAVTARSKLTAANSAQVAATAAVSKNASELQRLQGEAAAVNTQLSNLTKNTKNLDSATRTGISSIREIRKNLEEVQATAAKGGVRLQTQDVKALTAELDRLEARLKQVSALQSSRSRYSDGAGGMTRSGDAATMQKLQVQITQAKADAAAFRAEIDRIKGSLAGVRMSPNTKKEIAQLQQGINAANADARTLTNQFRQMGIASGRFHGNALDAWRKHNSESRTALSLYQRLRGQILSMVGAYVGLYGVVNIVREVTKAFMQQEAAMSRLGVVFDGDIQRMSVEMGWLRREAGRLGIEFGTLADEYTKFAVAGNMSGFQADSIRKIFTSVSEAARVNKLDLEAVKGTYLALSQMISKGKISAEELRQQLGERLPGAMSLMANALGVTTGELDKMMKEGKVLANEENMLKFGAELDKQFSKQLPAALRTFTTEWGKLQNTIFNAKATVGNGGLIDALTTVMKQMNDYANSREGVKFFLSLGAAMGDVVKWIPVLVDNFELLLKAIGVMIAIPFSKYIWGVVLSLKTFTGYVWGSVTAVWSSGNAWRAWLFAMSTTPGIIGKASLAIRGLGAALMTLGPLALGIGAAVALTSYLGSWESGVDSITEAQAQHSRIMDEILSKYDEAKTKTYDWKKAVSEKNREELAGQLTPNREAAATAQSNLSDIVSGTENFSYLKAMLPFYEADKAIEPIWSAKEIQERYGINPAITKNIQDQWRTFGRSLDTITRDDALRMRKSLSDYAESVPDTEMRDKLLKIVSAIDKFIATNDNVSANITVMRELGYAVEDTDNIVGRFPRTLEELANGTDEVVDKNAEFKKSVEDNFAKPLKNAIGVSDAFRAAMNPLGTALTEPFKKGEGSIGQMIAALAVLKLRQGEIQEAFRQFSQDGALDKLADKLSWMRQIPVLGNLLDRFMSGEMSKALGDKDVSTRDFEKLIGTTKGTEIEKIVQASSKIAEAIGVSTKDLLTVIGYETGGTFDKWKQGGAGGKYRGLIQWSPSNQDQYGLSAESTIEEQLAAVGKYLQDRGVKPGMGLLEIYAAINAGHVSKVNASDANNGGRPGTVRDKVYTDMDGHIANADKLLKLYGFSAEIGEREGKAIAEQEKLNKAKQEELDMNDEAVRLEQMKVDGKEREAFIQEKINAFTKQYGQQSEEELARLRQQYGALFDLQNMKSKDEQTQEAIKKHQEEINRLETERNALMEQRKHYEENGDTEKVEEVDKQLIAVNANLDAAIDRFIAFWKAAGGPEAAAGIAALEAAKLKLKDVQKEALLTGQQVNEKVAGGLSDSFTALAEALANGKNGLKGFRDAFLQFAGDFLVEIGKMIVQQTILNMLQNGGGANGGFGGWFTKILGSVTTGLFHSGKAPNQTSSGMSRRVSPALFAGAERYHSGKLPGLGANESAAIIENDEEILTRNNPRHIWNQRQQAPAPAQDNGSTIVNAFDAESFLEAGLSSPRGRKLYMNFVRANKTAIKGALG